MNFDTSNSLIFLTSPDNTTEAIMKNVKLIRLQNPKRVYFDINSAVLTAAPQSWFFSSGGVKQVKISQFSTSPSKIRVVLYLDEDFDPAKISFLKVNNNIVIKFKDGSGKADYFQNTYRDEKTSSSDFYEKLSISSEDMEKFKTAVNSAPPPTNDIVLNQIQQAFNSTNRPAVSVKPVTTKTPEAIKKELKLKSKYYLNMIYPRPNGFLLSGFGVVGIEKPMYLTNPARVVFDIPNAIVSPELKNREFKINQDTVKVGQFESNKARIVITSTQLEKYFPIFSSDGQSILFMNSETIDLDSLFTKTADAVSYHVKKVNALTSEFIVAFNAPVVHSIRRDGSKLTINFYNALRYSDPAFRSTVQATDFTDMKIDLLPQVGLKLVLPLEKDSLVNCYLGADGKSVKITLKGVTSRKPVYVAPKCVAQPRVNGKKFVVLDAGHGGSDYGAIREGINEKDITLDITKHVEAMLLSRGVTVAMTRDKDETVSLQDRMTFTANKSPDIFVSIHVNSSVKPEISGIETHYYHQNSLDMAQTIHSSLVSYVKSKDRGLFKSRFYVINHTNAPAILVEIGFISNDEERAELVSEKRKQQTAKAIADGILKYLNKK
ncbi:MAG: N-acetylmuramoyl-L-alanine amidase [Candidatus Gastranaerophilaceae bacterium]